MTCWTYVHLLKDLEDRRGQVIRRFLSTPSGTRMHSGMVSKMNRPKTAAAVLTKSDCERVLQLELEPTRRHNFENHLGTKRCKPPPWQNKLDGPLVPFVVGPGYILSKSKSKFAVTLRDDFFDPVPDEILKKKSGDTERDNLILQLQQQISDLTLYLEEERLNHKQTKQKAEEYLHDKIEDLNDHHQDQIRDLIEERNMYLSKQKSQLESEHNQYKANTENQIHKMVKEIEFLQGAFDSYKGTLNAEMGEKWVLKENEMRYKFDEEKQTAIHETKTKMIQEKNTEIGRHSKEHHRQIETLRKDNKKELDALIRRFSNVAADLERLKKTTTELEEIKAELCDVQKRYDETCLTLANTTRLLTDSKIKVLEFEEKFQEKVQSVDDKYRQKLDGLMTQNTELRRLYVKKCGELYDEKSLTEKESFERVETAKEAMAHVIKARERSNINMSANIPELDNVARRPKLRPGSAPTTRNETNSAHLSAGETDHLFKQKELIRPQTVNIPEAAPELEELRREVLSRDVKAFTKEQLLDSLDI